MKRGRAFFKILALGEKSEGLFLVEATYGWIDGAQSPVSAEISYSGVERRLRITTPPGSIIVAAQLQNGSFSGMFTPKNGTAKVVRLEKIAEQDILVRNKSVMAGKEAQVFADEDKDWGVEPTSRPRASQYHAPTPRTIPGARVIKTMELKNLLDIDKSVVIIDVLDGKERTTIPGAYLMLGAGSGQFFAAERERFSAALDKLTSGDKGRPIVFLCLSSECWVSYNASLYAIDAGYKNVIWYRGGTNAWSSAKLARKPAEQVNW